MDRHQQLPVWQLGRRLVSAVYTLTRQLPDEERFVVVPQLRRAAWSVPNNIAEGNAKLGRRELRRFLDIAIGSLAEVNSMTTILPDLYPHNRDSCVHVDLLRKEVAQGIYGILRHPSR